MSNQGVGNAVVVRVSSDIALTAFDIPSLFIIHSFISDLIRSSTITIAIVITAASSLSGVCVIMTAASSLSCVCMCVLS